MKKSDIIKLVKETIAERRKRYGQHDYYGNNVGGRSSISGMPGVWEEENEPQGPWSAGLEAREIADSFDFEEIEQLYKDGLIDSSNYNGAKWILQGWIDQHPTYLPQRDLTSPKRQRIRARYDTSAAGLTPGDPNWPGEDDRDNFPDPKDLKENKDKYLNENKMKKQTKEGLKEFEKNPDTSTTPTTTGADLTTKPEKGLGDVEIVLRQIDKINNPAELIQLLKKIMAHIGAGKVTGGSLALAKALGTNAGAAIRKQFSINEDKGSAFISGALAEYMKERGDSNLMEHMDRHRKRTRLMEGAVKRLFIDFDLGKTNEEIIQDYATKGIQIPDSWISQMRKEWEGFEKMKLNLDIGEKEFKNAATQIVNNPEGSETGMEPPIESKQLASGLSN